MKSCTSSLIAIAALGIPVALSVGIGTVTAEVLEWPQPLPIAASVGFIVLVLYGAYRWMGAMQKKEDEVVGELDDPVFGNVVRKRNCWEATMSLPRWAGPILVSGVAGNTPTELQRSTFEDVVDGWESWIAALDSALDSISDGADPARPRTIEPDSIILGDEANSWSMIFDVPGSTAKWGFSADFRDGELDELQEIH